VYVYVCVVVCVYVCVRVQASVVLHRRQWAYRPFEQPVTSPKMEAAALLSCVLLCGIMCCGGSGCTRSPRSCPSSQCESCCVVCCEGSECLRTDLVTLTDLREHQSGWRPCFLFKHTAVHTLLFEHTKVLVGEE
jgi:hypothetical protein